MTITNTGTAPDRLVGGTTDIAKSFEVHEMKMDGGVMKMRELAGGLEIKPGQTVTLDPSGYHVMFVGLKDQLKQGSHFKATLAVRQGRQGRRRLRRRGHRRQDRRRRHAERGRHENEVAVAAGAEGDHQPIAFGSQVASPVNANTSTSAINCMPRSMPRSMPRIDVAGGDLRRRHAAQEEQPFAAPRRLRVKPLLKSLAPA